MYGICYNMKLSPMEIGKMTYRELVSLKKQIELEKAVELDTKMRLAGSKTGNKYLEKLLHEDTLESVNKINTNEAILSNANLIKNIADIVKKGK